MPLPRNDPIHACLFANNSFPIFVRTPPFTKKKHATTPSISDTCLPATTFILFYHILYLLLLPHIAFNFSFICLHNHLHLSIPSIQHRIPSTPCVAQAPLAVIANALYPDLDESWAILYLLFNTYYFIYPGRNLWVDPVISIQAFFMYLVRFLLLSLCPAHTTAIDDTTTPPSTPSVDLSRVNFEFSSTIRRRDNVYFVPCTNHLLLVTL